MHVQGESPKTAAIPLRCGFINSPIQSEENVKIFVWISGIFAATLLAAYLCAPLETGIETPNGAKVLVGDYEAVLLNAVGIDWDPARGRTNKAVAGNQDRISREIFDDLTPGVTTLAVIERFLNSDDLVSSSYVAGVSTKSYVIRNSDGSSVSLIFQNGVLASKGQNGLR